MLSVDSPILAGDTGMRKVSYRCLVAVDFKGAHGQDWTEYGDLD